MPVSIPRADEFQYGAPSPVNAGTTYTPPLSSTLNAHFSLSSAEDIS